METDWSVAAGADDPLIEAPWQDAISGLRFVDLRTDAATQRERIAALPEAASAPALADALMQLNAPSGLLMTTKCDRWLLNAEERAQLADALDAPLAPCGCGSYIDVLIAHPLPMSDFLLHEEWVRATARGCAALEHPQARLDLVVRAAVRDSAWGYGLTVYHYAAGNSPQNAEGAWAAALRATVPVLLSAIAACLVETKERKG